MKRKLLIFLFSFAIAMTGYAQEKYSHELRKPADRLENNTRVVIGGGAAFRIGSSTNMPDTGFGFEAEIQSYSTNNWGWGFLVNYTQQEATEEGYFLGSYQADTKHHVLFFAPSVYKRFKNEKAALYIGTGLGGAWYNIKMEEDGYSFGKKADRILFGQHVGIAGEVKASEKVGFGLKISSLFSYTDLDNGKYLSNCFLSLFISFRSF